MGRLRALQSKVQPSQTSTGDAIPAIVLAVEMINILTKKLKYNRKIVMLTDGEAPVDEDDFAEISKQIKASGIQLTVL